MGTFQYHARLIKCYEENLQFVANAYQLVIYTMVLWRVNISTRLCELSMFANWQNSGSSHLQKSGMWACLVELKLADTSACAIYSESNDWPISCELYRYSSYTLLVDFLLLLLQYRNECIFLMHVSSYSCVYSEAMKNKYFQLSEQYHDAVFLKVDIHSCRVCSKNWAQETNSHLIINLCMAVSQYINA